jgi:hypothetical protein
MAPSSPVRDRTVEMSQRLLLHRRSAITEPCALAGVGELAEPLRRSRLPAGQPEVQLLQREVSTRTARPRNAASTPSSGQRRGIGGSRASSLRRSLADSRLACHDAQRRATHGGDEPRRRPQRRQPAQPRKLLAQPPRAAAVQQLHQPRQRHRRRDLDEQMRVVGDHLQADHRAVVLRDHLPHDRRQAARDRADKHPTAVTRALDDVVLRRVHRRVRRPKLAAPTNTGQNHGP